MIMARAYTFGCTALVRARTLSTTASSKAVQTYDAIIVGGGHNGLVCAAYLAKAGKRVCVLERRNVLGGAAITEEIVPGYKFSRASYVYSLFRPQIVSDLDLHRHGLKLLPRQPSSWTPVPGSGPSLLLGGTQAEDCASIAQFSKADADAYPRYNALLERYSSAFRPLLDRPPPDPGSLLEPSSPGWAANVRDSWTAAKSVAALGKDIPGFWEVLTAPASKILDRWFESPILRATLGTDAIIGAHCSPTTPGSAYVLLHHVMCGTWCNVQGGMGALSAAIGRAAVEAGATLRVSSPVARILVEDRPDTPGPGQGPARAVGVELQDGEVLKAPIVISNAAPSVLFQQLLPSSSLPPSFASHVRSIGVASGSVKINLALSRLPNFTCKPNTGDGKTAMPWHRGTIHFETCPSQIEAAYRDSLRGVPSTRPVIEMTLPTALDSTLAPEGKHVALLFVQYAPYDVSAWKGSAGWDSPGAREEFAARVYDVIEQHAPGFTASIEGQDILTPVDLERVFALPGGNIFHGAMGLDQLLWSRPVPGWARHRTPVQGVYLAGAGAHPGGGVMGAPGRNAAMTILSDMAAPGR